MKILLVGIDKSNFNYRKVEGFYNAFSKIGEVEWVTNFFDCKSNEYDIVFGEYGVQQLLSNFDRYKQMQIKAQVIWGAYEISNVIKLAEARPDIFFINAHKSSMFDTDALNEHISKYGNDYLRYGGEEGIHLPDYLGIKNPIRENLILAYLPYCLSEVHPFHETKNYDICYFGTLGNRPNIARMLESLSKDYTVLGNAWDRQGIIDPNSCYEYYKECKVTLSEQVHPIRLEYPVRLGEATSTGCRLFQLQSININTNSHLVPDYTACFDFDNMIDSVKNYLDNFSVEDSRKLYDSFTSTYDEAVEYVLHMIKTKTI